MSEEEIEGNNLQSQDSGKGKCGDRNDLQLSLEHDMHFNICATVTGYHRLGDLQTNELKLQVGSGQTGDGKSEY